MKKIILTLLGIILFSTLGFTQSLLREGDNLLNYINRNKVKFQLKGQRFSKWPESKTTYLAFNKNFDGKTPVIIIANNDFTIGVLQGKSPNAYYLFDLDGDGILDVKMTDAILPYWVVYLNSKNKTNNNNVKFIMTLVYESFQSNEGPMKNPKFVKSFNEIAKFYNKIDKENRDLVYLLSFYNRYSQKLMPQSLDCLNLLIKEYSNRFNEVHPLLLLYKAETLINLGNIDSAKTVINKLRRLDPTFIPAKVYEYKYESDKKKSNSLLNSLKNSHKNHWIVKKL